MLKKSLGARFAAAGVARGDAYCVSWFGRRPGHFQLGQLHGAGRR